GATLRRSSSSPGSLSLSFYQQFAARVHPLREWGGSLTDPDSPDASPRLVTGGDIETGEQVVKLLSRMATLHPTAQDLLKAQVLDLDLRELGARQGIELPNNLFMEKLATKRSSFAIISAEIGTGTACVHLQGCFIAATKEDETPAGLAKRRAADLHDVLGADLRPMERDGPVMRPVERLTLRWLLEEILYAIKCYRRKHVLWRLLGVWSIGIASQELWGWFLGLAKSGACFSTTCAGDCLREPLESMVDVFATSVQALNAHGGTVRTLVGSSQAMQPGDLNAIYGALALAGKSVGSSEAGLTSVASRIEHGAGGLPYYGVGGSQSVAGKSTKHNGQGNGLATAQCIKTKVWSTGALTKKSDSNGLLLRCTACQAKFAVGSPTCTHWVAGSFTRC
ncbi:hypothetical protein TSOC_014790, partial [Tetrabaena socialis]